MGGGLASECNRQSTRWPIYVPSTIRGPDVSLLCSATLTTARLARRQSLGVSLKWRTSCRDQAAAVWTSRGQTELSKILRSGACPQAKKYTRKTLISKNGAPPHISALPRGQPIHALLCVGDSYSAVKPWKNIQYYERKKSGPAGLISDKARRALSWNRARAAFLD